MYWAMLHESHAWGIVKRTPYLEIGDWLLIGVCVFSIAMVALLAWLWFIH
jgi:hypothetical protein